MRRAYKGLEGQGEERVIKFVKGGGRDDGNAGQRGSRSYGMGKGMVTKEKERSEGVWGERRGEELPHDFGFSPLLPRPPPLGPSPALVQVLVAYPISRWSTMSVYRHALDHPSSPPPPPPPLPLLLPPPPPPPRRTEPERKADEVELAADEVDDDGV